jgi:adenine/guanine phosphoribosyltransferase-like PRPP-binding protein
MKLYPRHRKVLSAVNGYSDLNYVCQRTGVQSVIQVAKELEKAGLIRVRKRGYMKRRSYSYSLVKTKGAYERTAAGHKIVGKHAW